MNDKIDKVLIEKKEICKDFHLFAYIRDSAVIIELDGTMSLSELDPFQSQLDSLLEEGQTFIFDLSLLKYLNSACIALFVQQYKKIDSAGKKMLMLSPPGYVLKVLTLVGLDKIMTICKDWQEINEKL